MKIKEVMTSGVECVRPETTLQEAAAKMKSLNVGPLPVCEGDRPIGIVTDRDIVVRGLTQRPVAPYKTPLTAADCMSVAVVTTPAGADVSEAARLMKENAVGRVVVVDDEGRCAGIVTQCDLERQVPLELLCTTQAPNGAYGHVT